jgi:glutaredoxin
MLKNYLKSHNIPFQDLDVAHDRNALMEMRQRTGQMGVPVIDIDCKVIIGFDKEEIAKALDIVEKV